MAKLVAPNAQSIQRRVARIERRPVDAADLWIGNHRIAAQCDENVRAKDNPRREAGIDWSYDPSMIARIADVKSLVVEGREDPASVFARVEKLARSDAWQTREVAATVMVEIAKVHPVAVLSQARSWARDADPNVRRTASEGLRGLIKKDPKGVLPVLNALREDHVLYVKKSVANLLRNASVAHPEFVLDTCRKWAKSPNAHTRWIVKDGLRKLLELQPEKVTPILRALTIVP